MFNFLSWIIIFFRVCLFDHDPNNIHTKKQLDLFLISSVSSHFSFIFQDLCSCYSWKKSHLIYFYNLILFQLYNILQEALLVLQMLDIWRIMLGKSLIYCLSHGNISMIVNNCISVMTIKRESCYFNSKPKFTDDIPVWCSSSVVGWIVFPQIICWNTNSWYLQTWSYLKTVSLKI